MSKTLHARRPRSARNRLDDVTSTRQPRPRQARTGTRHGILAAALREF